MSDPNRQSTTGVTSSLNPLPVHMSQRAANSGVVVIGTDPVGRPVVSDLRQNHLLAGIAGSGKSTMMQCMVASVIQSERPSNAQLILCDGKRGVEFHAFDCAPHLVFPVIDDTEELESAVECLLTEMERRFNLFKERRTQSTDFQHFPHTYIFVDEYADFALSGSLKDGMQRLAQKGRACKMSLILAAQRPTVDIVSGSLITNLPNRISFRTVNKRNSRIVLDLAGAEELAFPGGFILRNTTSAQLIHGKAKKIAIRELEHIVESAVYQFGPASYHVSDSPDGELASNFLMDRRNPLSIGSSLQSEIKDTLLEDSIDEDSSESAVSLFSWQTSGNHDGSQSPKLQPILELGQSAWEACFGVLEMSLSCVTVICRLVSHACRAKILDLNRRNPRNNR